MEKYRETLEFINSKINGFKPEIAIILGSGLSDFANEFEGISIDYSNIPHFPTSNVQGHKNRLLFCEIENKPSVIMQGRFHFYEGYSMKDTTYPIKIFKKLGVNNLFITNAAGAVSNELNVGDIMLITDHINFMGTNPLIGKNDDTLGERFPDMSDCYCEKFQNIARAAAKKVNINLKEGVYLATTGPSYETKAEVKMFKMLGASVIGMSSVPEAIVANYLKMNVLGFTTVTNHATGVSSNTLSHAEVLKAGKIASKKLAILIKEMIKNI